MTEGTDALEMPWPRWLQVFTLWFFWPVFRDLVQGATAAVLGVPL